MSVPRLRRIVALTPRREEEVAEQPDARRRRATGRPAGSRVERDQVHVRRRAGGPGSARPARSASIVRSFTPSISAHSKLSRRPLAPEVPSARRQQRVERVATVDRDELVPELVVGRVERHGQVDRQGRGGEAVDPGHEADGGDGEVPGRQAEVVVQPLDRRPDPVEVGQRLAHAHEHDVGQAPAQLAGSAAGTAPPARRSRPSTGGGRSPPGRWRRSRRPWRSRPAWTRTPWPGPGRA